MSADATQQERLERYRPTRIWKALDADRRLQAAAAFWRSDLVKDVDRAAAVEALATAMRFRPQSIRSAPTAKRAGFLAGCNTIPDHVAGTILYAYHMEHQVPLMSRFLDALEIPHEEGKITEEVERPSAESVEKAVETLLASGDREAVILYLQTLVSQDDETWSDLIPVIESLAEKT